VRIKCATLGWNTLDQVLNQADAWSRPRRLLYAPTGPCRTRRPTVRPRIRHGRENGCGWGNTGRLF